MIKMLRSFFGLQGESGKRMVVGQPVQVDLKDIQHIRNSNTRLAALLNLQNRYKGTMHEPKFRAVYEKTKRIHNYLVSKKRIHELELFHLQHTDHFISTFTVIMEVHQRHETGAPVPPEQAEAASERRVQEPAPEKARPAKYVADLARRVRSQSAGATAAATSGEAPKIAIPILAIDHFSSIVYARENDGAGTVVKEISYSSTDQDKAAFLTHISGRLGIGAGSLTYVGNAMLSAPSRDGVATTGYLPVVNWIGFSYALNLIDYRLFPITISRESL
ncbi:hypothetical protein [Pontibacter beigongshangensis]|uniref:hypothetical protein n=1 Tax=Pontibacter beigongshangensis TaxID=2574733 RepID=UPI00165077E6|nr:hypothetical protein [Pontibacter beigongshangensis]